MKKTKFALFAALSVGVLSAFTTMRTTQFLDEKLYEASDIAGGKIYLGEDLTNQTPGVDYDCDELVPVICAVIIDPNNIQSDENGPFVDEGDVISFIDGEFEDLKP